MPVIRLANIDPASNNAAAIAAFDPRLSVFSGMTDAELRDPRQMVGLARAIDPTRDANRLSDGLFIGESKNVIERALAAGIRPFALFVEDCWADQSASLVERLLDEDPDLPVFEAGRATARAVTGFERTRGALAAFHRPPLPDARELLRNARRVAVLENITNFTNIGAIFRSAAALGIDTVLVTPACHDPYYRRAARVSMGTVFQVPWTRIGDEADGSDWTRTGIPLLHEMGFETVALALSDNSVPLQDKRLKKHERIALVLGTEGDGLAMRTIAACDCTVRIPMDHDVDSLNVAAASAVAFWELRTRHLS